MPPQKASILIVDDELSVRDSLLHWFRKDGFEVATAASATLALKALEEGPADIILLDIKMPGMDGMELQSRIRATHPKIIVIMMTAFASVDTAVRALKQGAFDYVTKPIDPDELSHLVARALKERRLEDENSQLRETIAELSSADFVIGESPAMHKVMEMIRQVAQTNATVMIRGESGTGKELVARTIHANSSRKYFPIVPINCGALPDSLLESELFGHARGAFTDAKEARTGLFLKAGVGTLFLDEIGDMPGGMQAKLLRALEARVVRPVGSDNEIPFRARIVAATNRDLESEVEEGRFRQDLYFRINVIRIPVPPLRARGGDILLLAQSFAQKLAKRAGKNVTGLSTPAAERLLAYPWPGNVRELQNALERAVALTRYEEIVVEDLPEAVRSYRRAPLLPSGDDPTELLPMHEVEKRYILRVLEAVGGNKTLAAQILGFDRRTMYRKLDRYEKGR